MATVQDALSLDDGKLASALGIQLERFLELKERQVDLPASGILRLSEQLNLDPESFCHGTFDQKLLRLDSGQVQLSPRYHDRAFSRRRTSLHLLKFCDAHFGTRTTFSLLKKLQVRREVFNSPDKFINLRFLIDACDYLKSIGLPEERFFQIRTHSASVNRKSALADELRKTKSVKDALDLQINHLVHYYDLNYRYWMEELTQTSCVYASAPKQQLQEALKQRLPGSRLTCLTRIGVSSAITTLIDLPFSPVQKISCIHEGDSSCKYFINFELAHRFKSKEYKLLQT